MDMPKPRKVGMSNWEAPKLKPAQIRYAAMDAFVTGHAFRGLRACRHAFQRPLRPLTRRKVVLDPARARVL